MAIHLSERVRFGRFELNLQTGELVPNERGVAGSPPQKILLREQPFQILRLLVERGGKIVTRDEIKKLLWPNDTIVDFDRSINVAMAILRRSVGMYFVKCSSLLLRTQNKENSARRRGIIESACGCRRIVSL